MFGLALISLAAAAKVTNPATLGPRITVQNMDDYFAVGLYYAGPAPAKSRTGADLHLIPPSHHALTDDYGMHEKLIQVIPPGGKVTQSTHLGHRLVARSADFKFRVGMQVEANNRGSAGTHPYLVTFRNMAFEEAHSAVEMKSHDHVWIKKGMSHTRATDVDHPFSFTDIEHIPRVSFKLHPPKTDL